MRNLNLKQPVWRGPHVRAILVLGAILAAFFYGVGVGVYHWPPYSGIRIIVKTSLDRAASVPSSRHTNSYTVQTRIHSYFKRDEGGKLELREGLPYKSEREYLLTRTIHPGRTALIIMDPWVDMAAAEMNAFFGRVTESRILPLAEAAIRRGHPIIILTNDPKKVNYNTRIHSGLRAFAEAGDATVVYHQDADDRQFASLLRSKGIQSLIYVGFASNMCVMGRPMGMIPMKHQGFDIFFVPEASAAVELPGTWENQSIHDATTSIVSQWIAEIIHYEKLLEAMVSGQGTVSTGDAPANKSVQATP